MLRTYIPNSGAFRPAQSRGLRSGVPRMARGAARKSGADIFQNEGATTPKLRRRHLVLPKWSAAASQKSRGVVYQKRGTECQAALLNNRAAIFSKMRGRRPPNCGAATWIVFQSEASSLKLAANFEKSHFSWFSTRKVLVRSPGNWWAEAKSDPPDFTIAPSLPAN